MLIHVGSGEVLLDDARRIAEKAQKVGVTTELRIWEGMPHVWHIYGFLPEAQQTPHEITQFLKGCILE